MADYPVISRGIGRKPPSSIRTDKRTAFVALSMGFEAVIDIDDVAEIAGYRWSTFAGQTGHAYATRYESGKIIFMHRQLMNAPTGLQVDHVDGDGLNNRRLNMRLATPAQNQANKVVGRRNKLALKGVSERDGKYRAVITPNGKTIHLGSYPTKEEAAAAYKGAALIVWGEFAYK